jgi:hypothetical protein
MPAPQKKITRPSSLATSSSSGINGPFAKKCIYLNNSRRFAMPAQRAQVTRKAGHRLSKIFSTSLSGFGPATPSPIPVGCGTSSSAGRLSVGLA